MSNLRFLYGVLALLLLVAVPDLASAAKPGRAATPKMTLEHGTARLTLAPPEVTKMRDEDALRDLDHATPVRYGRVLPTGKLDARAGAGVWKRLPDGDWSWRLEVSAAGAKSLEFAFSRLRLPHGATLLVRSADGNQVIGPLTDADNPVGGTLYTPILATDRAVLELGVPAAKRDALELTLAAVVWGYRDPFTAVRAKSGSCNVDAICPEGNAWRDQIAAVAGYAFSDDGQPDRLMCTGTLLDTGNTGQDAGQPRFATAYHCVSSEEEAATMVFYWGYESPTCRAIGSDENGTQLPVRANTRAVQMGGATLIATNRETDVTAVQLNTTIPPEAQAYYSGWDRSGVLPPGSIGIHHPSGHEKRLSLDNDPLSTMASCIINDSGPATHWHVGPYEAGTTEGGSSGSGLWNLANGLLVGVLSGGNASCGNASGYDCYGRLSAAWEASSLTGTTIRAAFDRSGTNPTTMPGKGSCAAPQVSLSSGAFNTAPKAGETFSIRATASGGAGGYTFLWDADDDGVVEREGGDTIQLAFPGRRALNVRVRVRDASGCIGSTSRALEIAAPVISVAGVGARQQLCGNGNGKVDPGERYALPITVRNDGNAALPAGARALFAPASSLPGNGIVNQFGYQGAASCAYGFIDIAEGAYAVPPLTTHVANGNEYGPNDDARSSTIALGGSGFPIFGSPRTQAVMSTNGYVSFDPEESGGDWSPACDGELDQGARGPQLRPYHDDMVVREQAGAGLRYRWFTSCPRLAASGVAQGCHVFQWSHMGYYVSATETDGDFDFEAVAYAQTGEVAYQYRTASPDEGDLANIGLIDANGDDPLNLWCESYAHPAKAQSAICIHSPQALAAAAPGLRLESPTVVLPAIAPGASASINLPIAIRPGVACGAPLNLDYLATAASGSSSAETSHIALGQVDASCVAVTSCPAQVAAINTRDGNYFNPERAGNGFNYHVFGGIWYTADAANLPTWYTVTGEFADNLLSGPLTRTTLPGGPPPEAGSIPGGQLPVEQVTIGSLHIARVAPEQILMAWSMGNGRGGAEVLHLTTGGLARANPDHTQHWYPPSEAGWGLDVESVVVSQKRFDSTLPYFYDAQGRPRWVLSNGFIDANGLLPLDAYRPHCPGCPHYADWDAATRVKPAGNLRIRWSDPGHATISTDITLPVPLQGQWRRQDKALVPIGEIRP